MRGTSGTLSRRYARALLEVALEKKADGEALRRELGEASAILVGNPELARVLLHPAVSADKKKAILAALWKTSEPSPLLKRLLDLLAERDRLAVLPGIADAYAALWNERQGVVAAEATTAVELTDAQRSALAAALEKTSGRKIELRARVEPEVLGGLLVRMGGKTYDGTVRGRLKALRESLAQGL